MNARLCSPSPRGATPTVGRHIDLTGGREKGPFGVSAAFEHQRADIMLRVSGEKRKADEGDDGCRCRYNGEGPGAAPRSDERCRSGRMDVVSLSLKVFMECEETSTGQMGR